MEKMELRHLRAFVAVATTGHFGQAAARLNLTQPGLSLRIQALERELGVQLLDRNAREVRLTALGDVLLPYAKRLIDVEDIALSEIRQHTAANAGRVRISYLTLWDGLPTSIVSAFKLRHPAVTVDTTSGYSQMNLERVVKREADIAFLTLGSGDLDAVSMRPIDRQQIVLVMTPTHRLATLDSIPVRELRGEPFIALSAGVNNTMARTTISWLAHHLGEDPNVVAYEPPDQMAGAVAHRGNAVTLLTEVRATAAAGLGVVYRRLLPSPMLEYGVAYRKDNHSTALVQLLDIVDEFATPLARQLPIGHEIMSTAVAAREVG
jgi:DNA-binding transcriptional LysR family regulator